MDIKGPKSGFLAARWLFLRLVALAYLSGFLSLSVQINGLYGQDGILPIAHLLQGSTDGPLLANMLNAPTIFWLNASDPFINAMPIAGIFVSVLACLGIFSGPSLLAAWFLYLSIITVGQDFMSFQWDILLNETGFLALFLCSWRPFCQSWNSICRRFKLPDWVVDRSPASIFVLWLLRLLLFKLMFASGVVKLTSHDPTWWNLTAMTYHYETQPLPTPLGYFAHQLPDWFQICSTAGVFFIEILVPFCIFAPRKLRIAAATLLMFLQVLIALTGNYCFFNWITIALCLLMIDDAAMLYPITKFLPQKLSSKVKELMTTAFEWGREPADGTAHSTSKLGPLILFPLLSLILFLSSFSLYRQFLGAWGFPEPAESIISIAHSWRLVGSYGLFAVMTTYRPEIIIEGSADGRTWKEYVFKYKPGPLRRPPPVVAPHQPRLDWQMWFAALSDSPSDQWFLRFVQKLLDGSTSVSGLLEHNPFEGSRPRFIRAQLYDYHFTSVGHLFRNGQWWTRKFKRNFLPTVSIESNP
jgi:lipase maturation factor 1